MTGPANGALITVECLTGAEALLQPGRAARSSVLLSATIEQFGTGKVLTHKVRDLSSGGVRVDQGEALLKGATVVVTVGSLTAIPATVAWVIDGWAGLHFAQGIDPDHARARASVKPKPGIAPNTPGPIYTKAPTAGWAGEMRNPYNR